MKGTIVNYRKSVHRQKTNQMVVVVENITSKEEAEKLLGKKVVWKSPANKEIKGEIRATHGNKGALRVLFETGMPGQSIAQKVDIK